MASRMAGGSAPPRPAAKSAPAAPSPARPPPPAPPPPAPPPGPLRPPASHGPLEPAECRGTRAGSKRNSAFCAAAWAVALVLAFGICDGRHRTALLSQLVTGNARAPPGEDARRSAAGGRGRVGTAARISSQRPLSGTKVASKRVAPPPTR